MPNKKPGWPTAAQTSLRRLHHLRLCLDHWRAAGCADPMPQPASFNLHLPPMRPSEVLWPSDNGGGHA